MSESQILTLEPRVVVIEDMVRLRQIAEAV